jgi:hypothetical protein
MPYTVTASFDKFYENINLPGDHRETANSRRDDILETLKTSFVIIEAFASGSIPRYTAVKGYADLDVIVALHYGKHIKGKKPSEVLQAVRDALAEYRTNVRKNGQAVTLYYKTWPNVDIVPASQIVDDAGHVTAYEIPDMKTESWIQSKPKEHSFNINERARTCGPSFRKIITMIKWWNHQHSEYLQSYHIEAMALEIFSNTLSDMPWDVFTFFDKASGLIVSSLWYEGGYVDAYLSDEERQEAKKRLETARDKSRDAWYKTHGNNNDHEGAIKIWSQIFGDKFPNYG